MAFEERATTSGKFVRKARGLAKQEKYEEALKWYIKAIKERRKVSNTTKNFSWSQELQKQLKWLEKSSLWLGEALQLAKKHKLISKAIDIYEVEEKWDFAIKLCYKNGNVERANAILEGLIQKKRFLIVADIFKQMKNYEKAMEYYEKEIDHSLELYEKDIHHRLAACPLTNAESVIAEAIKLAKSKSLDKRIDDLYRKLIKVYELSGDYQMIEPVNETDIAWAHEYYEKAARLAKRVKRLKEKLK